MRDERPAVPVIRTLFIHLRLPFQMLLAPVFLWGWLVAGGARSTTVVIGFLLFHVCLYGGATAYNSYYDRDEGPIGGLEHPPPVIPALLPFSLAVELTGWALSVLVNLPFFALYGGILALFTVYSHPATRWKGKPLPSLVAVGLGQGVLAFLGGFAASNGGDLSVAWGQAGVAGALAATLLILGVYPLTQVFQVEEDRARGDQTVAVAWGPRACFVFSLACQAVGGAAMVFVLAGRFGVIDGFVVGGAVAAGILAWVVWACRFDITQVMSNYRYVMRRNALSALGLWLYVGFHLARG